MSVSATAIQNLTIHRLSIPMKQRVEHATSVRQMADPMVVSVELQNGMQGYGETLPRTYVTGEDHETVVKTIREFFVPRLMNLRPESFTEAVEFIESLPCHDDRGRLVTAARAAVELALLDAYSRCFGRAIGESVCRWLDVKAMGNPGSIAQVRCAGILASSEIGRTLRKLRWMRWYGLRDFKLKVGTPYDDEQVRAVTCQLRRPLCAGRVRLRLDANGAWSLDQAIQKLSRWSEIEGISKWIEQPLAKEADSDLPELARRTGWNIIHDESFATVEDVRRLIDSKAGQCFNIRISKCGGLIPSLKLAAMCLQNGATIMLGCMVGQTSILSAVERRFLNCVPNVQFAETNYGRFLLADDVAYPRLRFGYGGRLKPLRDPAGWGVRIDENKLRLLGVAPPVTIPL